MAAGSDAFQLNIGQWPDFNDYRQLNLSTNEIRLLRVRALDNKDSSESSIRCSLFHYSLDNVDNTLVPYSALSYYWGAPCRVYTNLGERLCN